jgi:hypothetical protein
MLVEDTQQEVLVPGFCDRCGAKAAFLAAKEELVLLFCAHHHRENEKGLKTKGFSITNVQD